MMRNRGFRKLFQDSGDIPASVKGATDRTLRALPEQLSNELHNSVDKRGALAIFPSRLLVTCACLALCFACAGALLFAGLLDPGNHVSKAEFHDDLESLSSAIDLLGHDALQDENGNALNGSETSGDYGKLIESLESIEADYTARADAMSSDDDFSRLREEMNEHVEAAFTQAGVPNDVFLQSD